MGVNKKRDKIGEKHKKKQRIVRRKMLDDSEVLRKASEEEEASEKRQNMRGVGFKRRKVTQFHGVRDALCPQLSIGPIAPPVLPTEKRGLCFETVQIKMLFTIY